MANNPQRDDWIQRRLDGIWWRIKSGYQDRFFAAWRSGWRDAQVVRVTPDRRVLRIEGRPVIWVKHFRHRSLRGWAKSLLRKSPAAREWEALQEVRRRGLPAPEPIGLGEGGGFAKRESFLVTAELEGGVPLDDLILGRNRFNARKRWRSIAEVAALIRKAHDRGICQRDLHLGNILVREVKNGLEVVLIDLQRLTVAGSLTSRKRVANLAVLQGGCTDVSRTDQVRFLQHYLSYPAPLPYDLRQLVSQLERKGRRHRFKLWRSRQKRCLAENREFVKIQVGAFFGFARREHWNQDLQRLLREPEKIFHHSATQVVKTSTTTSVAVVSHSGGRCYVKRYNYQGVGYAIKDLFRSSRARRAWIAANSLHMRGIPVALPLACLERRRLGVLLESYILTEAKSGRSLRLILNDYDKSGSMVKTKRALLDALARLVRKMHARGVAHRDLKGANLIAQTGPNDVCDLFIVDFDGISLGSISRNRRERDLARLAEERHRHRCLTRSDRLRFLKTYLTPSKEKGWKEIWKAVARRCR